jgi:hypothetical protein
LYEYSPTARMPPYQVETSVATKPGSVTAREATRYSAAPFRCGPKIRRVTYSRNAP